MYNFPTFVNPQQIRVLKYRWYIIIEITDSNGIPHKYVASADEIATAKDQIWFGTLDEYKELD